MADFMLTGIFKGDAYSGSCGDADDSVVTRDEEHRLGYGFPIQQEVTVRVQLRGLNKHIREFSKRQLTRDTDTLLELQGTFGLYAQTKELYLLHGYPCGWTESSDSTLVLNSLSVCQSPRGITVQAQIDLCMRLRRVGEKHICRLGYGQDGSAQ